MNDDADVKGGPDSIPKSSAKALDDGYNQTYVIMKNQHADAKKSEEDHAVFFRCGNWCYMGQIQFNGLKIGTSDLSLLIPTLQKQQGSLRYYCSSSNVPSTSDYSEPLKFLRKATEFVANEMTSLAIEKELRKMSTVFPWIDADGVSTYFELTMNDTPKYMEDVGLVASKTYTRGLIIISIYAEKTFYFVIQSGEGDQALLDVNFPDVSKHGQGLLLQTYNDQSNAWRKLTLWHVLDVSTSISNPRVVPKIRTVNISTANYQQTYCVMKSSFDDSTSSLSVHHDVLFRFGSWCYSGRVQLTPTLTLSDIPFVIPALRMQQSRLDYYCDVSRIPTNSPFARSLDYIQKLEPIIESQMFNSEDILRGLIARLTEMGLGDTVTKWLEGDPGNSFFEFKLSSEEQKAEYFKDIELIASKCYHPTGIITITILFQNTIYVSLLEGDKENPLLDSKFPDVSGKGRGYLIQAFPEGLPEWEELRKVSIWQTVGALEQEFRDRAVNVAQDKSNREELFSDCNNIEDWEGMSVDKIKSYQQALVSGSSNSPKINSIKNSDNTIDGMSTNRNKEHSKDQIIDKDKDEKGHGGFISSNSNTRSSDIDDSSPFSEMILSVSTSPSKGLDTDTVTPDVAEEKQSPSSAEKEKNKQYTGTGTGASSKMSDIDLHLNEGVRWQLERRESHVGSKGEREGENDGDDQELSALKGVETGTGTVSCSGRAQDPIISQTTSSNGKRNSLSGFDALAITKDALGSVSASVARPHHLPKMENSLGKKMDEIRRTMGMGDGVSSAPWDSKGRPMKSRNVLSSPNHDGSKK